MSLESTEPPDDQPDERPDERPRGQRRRLLDDPRAIRAMAHPIRLDLQSLIGRAGRITAADAARSLGISHALASHHLRQLAKYGFVEQAGAADNRERPWQLVHTSISVEGIEDQPGGADAVDVLERLTAERALEMLARWQERKASMPEGWRKNSGIGNSTVYLTEAELAEVVAMFEKTLTDYVERRPLDDLASRPEGSLPVTFTMIVVPETGL
jgi:DNA-binding transcriptional ArsR family regulator